MSVSPVEVAVAESDRKWAAAVHVSSIFWPLIGPLAGWLFFRRAVFVAAHARRALFETLILQFALCLGGTASLIYTIIRIVGYAQNNWENVNWWEFVVRFAVGFLIVAILQVVNIVMAIRQAWGAWHGKWPGKQPQAVHTTELHD